MDSKVVNKLIRSEVWPVLRRQGFTKFDSRNAWRYRGPLVDVVNFRSFNSYVAEVVGCTTYSFNLTLGVYLRGSGYDRSVKRDSRGLLYPELSVCPFMVSLKKRDEVDGFKQADVFLVAENGSTIAAVLREVIYLLEEQAPVWFGVFEDLEGVVRALSAEGIRLKGTETLGLGHSGTPGSYSACNLIASLQIERHRQAPGAVSAESCLQAIDATVGAMQNLLLPLFKDPNAVEHYSRRSRDLLMQIRASIPVSKDQFEVVPRECQLLGANWDDGPEASGASEAAMAGLLINAPEFFWPHLREDGFVEFTERLAHRPVGDAIEVVSIVPMDPVEKRKKNYPAGLFHIGLGIFWPLLAEGEDVRRNRRGEFRPKLVECQLQMWLMPGIRAAYGGPTCFDSPDVAALSLKQNAQRWFSLCRYGESFRRLLDKPNWEILMSQPTMRGHGAPGSVYRALLRLAVSEQQEETREALLGKAYEAVNHHVEHERPHLRRWVERVKAKFARSTLS